MNPLCFEVEKGEPPSLGPLPTSGMNMAVLEHGNLEGGAEVCRRDVSTRRAELWSWGRERTSPGKKKNPPPSSQGRTRGCWRVLGH